MIHKKIRFTGIVLALAMGLAGTSAGADWVRLGSGAGLNIDPVNASVNYPKLAVDRGTPYVVWQEMPIAGAYGIYMKHWNGSAWTQDGGKLNRTINYNAYYPCVVFNNGAPYVAWYEYDASGIATQIYVSHWSGADWISDSSGLNMVATHSAYHPAAAAYAGKVYITWQENAIASIFVKNYIGGGWQSVPLNGGSVNVNNGKSAGKPNLAIAGDGTVYAAWQQYDAGGTTLQVYAAHWDGMNWVQDGGGNPLNIDPGKNAYGPSLAVANGTPYLAWYEGAPGTNQVYVKHFNGSSWVQDGGSLNHDAQHAAITPSLAIDHGVPYVAWCEFLGATAQIYVKHLSGGNWVSDGGSLNLDPLLNAHDPNLVIDEGKVYVAWAEANGASPSRDQVYIKSYTIPTPTPTVTPTLIPTPAPPKTFFKVYQSRINPHAGEQAVIKWSQPAAGSVTISIHNLLGDKIVTLVNGEAYSGGQYHQVTWNGRNRNGDAVGNGIYLVDLRAGELKTWGKIAVVK